ncbi:MAG: hypothetical protein ABW036_05860, partial [Flavitalea sp.]
MIRGFLIIILGLGGLLCSAQQADTLIPDAQAFADSSAITDLVHIVRENSKVVLNWRLSDSIATEFFSIERSSNNKDYEVVAVIKLAQITQWFEWVDESPAKGKNIYRIKCASKNNTQVYSKSLAVQ